MQNSGTRKDFGYPYRSIALIELSEDHSFYYLQFNECKYDEERTVREFENYLIDLTNVEHAK